MRANLAKETWAPKLGVEMDIALDIPTALEHLSGHKEYAVFFVGPGMCSILGQSGTEEVFAQVRAVQPQMKCVLVENVPQYISVLGPALGLEGFDKEVKTMADN